MRALTLLVSLACAATVLSRKRRGEHVVDVTPAG